MLGPTFNMNCDAGLGCGRGRRVRSSPSFFSISSGLAEGFATSLDSAGAGASGKSGTQKQCD